MNATPAAQVWLDDQAFSVEGMGTALPGAAISSADLLDDVDRRFGLALGSRGRAVARRLGVHSRHICRDFEQRHESARAEDSNAALAARAVAAALEQAGRRVDDLCYLIAHTATPDCSLPPGVAAVAQRLDYRGPFAEFRQACTGFANALVFARAVLTANDGVVAIVGSETGSLYFDPLRAADSTAQLVNMLQMGDGAAAIVLGTARAGAPQLQRAFFGHCGLGRMPGFQLAAGAREFSHDYAAVRAQGEQLFRAGLAAASRQGIALADCDWLLPHQANGRMAGLLGSALAFEPERIFVNADRLGNTGSAAIWLGLAELRQQMRPGERALTLGAEATQYMYGGFRYVHA